MPLFRLSNKGGKSRRSDRRSSSPKASNTKRRQQQQRKVTFMSDIDIENIEAYENPNDIWFGEQEEQEFKERDLKMESLLKHMTAAELEIKSGESARGLEHAFQGEAATKAEILLRRNESIQVVLQIQASTKKQIIGSKDDATKRRAEQSEAIRREYTRVTEHSQQDAMVRALEDEHFVNDHVRLATPENGRIFEKRNARPSLMGRQPARRSLDKPVTVVATC